MTTRSTSPPLPPVLYDLDAVREAIKTREYLEAFALWEEEWIWRLFGRLSCRDRTPLDVFRFRVHQFLKNLNISDPYAAVFYHLDPMLHAHLLVGGWRATFAPRVEKYMEHLWTHRWPHGEAWVERYQPHAGGVGYVARFLMEDRDADAWAAWELLGQPKRVRHRTQ